MNLARGNIGWARKTSSDDYIDGRRITKKEIVESGSRLTRRRVVVCFLRFDGGLDFFGGLKFDCSPSSEYLRGDDVKKRKVLSKDWCRERICIINDRIWFDASHSVDAR
jgi:hypothetical protein